MQSQTLEVEKPACFEIWPSKSAAQTLASVLWPQPPYRLIHVKKKPCLIWNSALKLQISNSDSVAIRAQKRNLNCPWKSAMIYHCKININMKYIIPQSLRTEYNIFEESDYLPEGGIRMMVASGNRVSGNSVPFWATTFVLMVKWESKFNFISRRMSVISIL